MDHLAPPFEPGEWISVAMAMEIASVCERTIQNWCADHGIGRKAAGRWRVSKVALDMLLSDDQEALGLYREGDRASPRVVAYFARSGVEIVYSRPQAPAYAV